MRYLVHIPLIGGFSIANMHVTGKPPVAISSFSPFGANDALLQQYLKEQGHNVPYYNLDESEKYLSHLKSFGQLDFISAVPPCSGLSMSSALKKGARQNSPVNDWMIKSASLAMKELKPKVFMFENAPGLFTNVGVEVRKNLENIALKEGYAGTYYKTDTLLHGIPQRRPRTYGIFVQGENAPILNNIKRPYIPIIDYLKQIPKEATLQDKYMVKDPNIENYEIYKFIHNKIGDDWRKEFLKVKKHVTSYDYLDAKGMLEEYRDYVEKYPDAHPTTIKDAKHVIKKLAMGKNFRVSHRLLLVDVDYVYAVIGEMMERNVHPTENRRMNIREYLTLMNMPFNFQIDNPRNYNMLTQNTPVKTSEDITKEAIAIINNKREWHTDRFLMQDNIKYSKNNYNSISLF